MMTLLGYHSIFVIHFALNLEIYYRLVCDT